MKNFKLLLATAVLFAVGSAFASSTKAEDLYVRNSNGTYQLKTGHCEVQDNSTCSYNIIDPNGPLNQDSNFTEAEPGVYVP
ncbi:DUF6520 family protein [Pedobacter alluvionis]|uniref:Uncharacterized protein n=1 Tax=Pedobacter alluvionis TaxID=475253 RepID=A0A497Y0G5_9SPHI|nr:DUF6520 family protein [Pedobacter alluvionis]RLJ75146.1 hypothetical protein BCL90_3495 [Pedobacter alluvionis]TFB30249.1 hypothetical protein E3V97_18950 [Pedobacter alluvionis]